MWNLTSPLLIQDISENRQFCLTKCFSNRKGLANFSKIFYVLENSEG